MQVHQSNQVSLMLLFHPNVGTGHRSTVIGEKHDTDDR